VTSGAGVVETRDGLRLAYRLSGTGPPLVCQSGGPGRASTYLRDLGGLTASRTLVLLDSRGTGASDRPDTPDKLQAPHLAGDLDDLRAHLGLDTMDLLAHSAGAVVAQLYAAAHPHGLHRLVLVTPSGRLQGHTGQDIAAIVASRRGEPGYDDAIDAYEAYDHAPAAERRRLDALTRPLMYGIWNDVTAAHAAAAGSELDRVAESNFRPPPGSVDEAAITAALAEVTAPVLVVAGDKDGATGVAGARAVAACFKDARLEVLEGIGHFPWVEQPAAFVPVVGDFLDAG
jgi:pimeloyl-ACP methyl ester carboxylesterase